MDGCKVKSCPRPVYVAGMCSTHYSRLRETGTTEDGPRAKAPLAERLWKNVDRSDAFGCWPWVGQSRNHGYGYLSKGGRAEGKIQSHRAAWLVTFGEPAKGKVVRHMCHNRLCCNPSHLAVGTPAENVRDMWEREEGPKTGARLAYSDVMAIRLDNRKAGAVARAFGITPGHVWQIRSGRSWNIAPKRGIHHGDP